MEFRPYLGDNRLKNRIVYEGPNKSFCIYCGKVADSREHIPSKVFLDKPFPADLYLVPACRVCNNSFSSDELYTWFVIKLLEQRAGIDCLSTSYQSAKRFASHPGVHSEAQNDISLFINRPNSFDVHKTLFDFKSERIARILKKLAVGHAVYELSECYYSESLDTWKTSTIEYSFAPTLSQEIIDDFNCAIDINGLVLPEIGSRVYENIYVITLPLCPIEGDNNMALGVVLLDWTDVQDNRYRYIAVHSPTSIQVNIVIDEFLYAAVILQR